MLFRSHKRQPIVYMEEAFPRRLLSRDLASIDWENSLTALLADHGRRLVSSQAHIRAVSLPRRIERWLEKGDAQSWMEITETDLDAHGNPTVFSRNYLRGDMFAFNFRRYIEI